LICDAETVSSCTPMRPATNQPKVSMIWASVKEGAGAAGSAAGAGVAAAGQYQQKGWSNAAQEESGAEGHEEGRQSRSIAPRCRP
jgi:hypothetical protein